MSNGVLLEDPFDQAQAKRLINQMAGNDATTITYSHHAEVRCDERELNPVWIQQVLKLGDVINVAEHELRNNTTQIRYKVRHIDQYGRTDVITVIASKARLVIITVMRND